MSWAWNYPLYWGGDPTRSVFSPPRYRRVCIKRWPLQAVTLEEAVLHLRLDPDAVDGPEKSLIEGLIAAATRAAEDYADIAVMEQDWRMTLQYWPPYGQGLVLPTPPFSELLRIRVDQVVLPLSGFQVEQDEFLPATLYPLSNSWPSIIARDHDAVEIIWRCGRDKPEDVSPAIRQAILMAIANWYENRESLQQFVLTPMLELGWKPLLGNYREVGFA